MKVKTILILSLIAVLGLGLATAQAAPGQLGTGGKKGGDRIGPQLERGFALGSAGGGRMLGGLYERLGLTKEQKKKMRALVAGFLDLTRSARTTKMALKDEKRAMIISGKIDLKRLAAIDGEIVKSKSQVMKERLKMKREKLALLTDDQRDRLGEIMALKASHKRHHGKRRGRFFRN